VTCECVRQEMWEGNSLKQEVRNKMEYAWQVAQAVRFRRQWSIIHEGKVVARHLAGPRGEQWLFNGSKELRFG